MAKNKRLATANTAKPITRLQVKAMLNSRMLPFYNDASSGATTTYDWTGVVHDITGIAVGAGPTGRTTSRVHLRSIELRATWLQSNAYHFRFVLVQDTMGSGTTPSPSDILQTVGGVFSVISPYNFDQVVAAHRFRILCDHHVYPNEGSSTGPIKFFEVSKKLRGEMDFVGGNDTRNALYLMVVSDQSTAVGAVRWYTRVHYSATD